MIKKKSLSIIKNNLIEHHLVIQNLDDQIKEQIYSVSEKIAKSLKKGGTIFWCGNGGSASDSMHLSAELIGKFKKKRKPLKSISLCGNPSTLTCIANDFGFQNIFSRQLEALAKQGDILIAISTSGKSKNIIEALKIAKRLKVFSITLAGNGGGQCKKYSNKSLIVKSQNVARIQETHILIGHIICELIEKNLNL